VAERLKWACKIGFDCVCWRRKVTGNPNSAESPKGYSKCLVIWLDMLGFSKWIERSERDEDQVVSIKGVLETEERTVSKVNLRPKGGWRRNTLARQFSDTIVVTIENPDFLSLSNVCTFVEQFNMDMVVKGCFLRGAVVLGDACATQNLLFGPAVIEAIQLEKVASWPRIIVHPSVLKRLAEDVLMTPEVKEQLEKFHMPMDRDGLRYINYLGQSFALHEATRWEYQYRKRSMPDGLGIDALIVHKTAITDGISRVRASATPMPVSTIAKYHSLAMYHNDVIDVLHRYLESSTQRPQEYSFHLSHLLRAHFYPQAVFGPKPEADAFFDTRLDELMKNRDSLLPKKITDLPGLFPELYPPLSSVAVE